MLLRLLFSRTSHTGCPEEFAPTAPIELIAVPSARLDLWDERSHPAVESVPVAELRRGGTATLAPRASRTRGGAGLELDLADNRRLDSLPSELRTRLPSRGLVNLAEARLVVQTLETMLLDPACQSLFSDTPVDEPQIAVLSLHPAQVELLRF